MVHFSLNFDLFNNYYYFYERLLVLLFSLVPAILLVVFVLYTDRKSKEPTKNIVICLLSGTLTVALAGYLEQLVMPYFSSSVALTYVWALIEELCKLSVFFLFIFDNKHYDDIYDGIVYMALIALSFAGLENIMYAFSESTVSESISLALMRDFTTIPLHVICGIVIGYFASLGNFSKNVNKKYINFTLAVIVPSVIHGTFNLLMSFLGNINVNYSNPASVLLLQALPLILIMIVLFIIAIYTTKKTVDLNKIYVSNETYNDSHNYLMNYEEYMNSDSKKRRINMYNKISRNKDEDNEVAENATDGIKKDIDFNNVDNAIIGVNEENNTIENDIKDDNITNIDNDIDLDNNVTDINGDNEEIKNKLDELFDEEFDKN